MAITFVWEDRTITIFEGKKDAPLVLIHENQEEGEQIWKHLVEEKVSCTLACIHGIVWNHDLAPWDAPAAFRKAEPFTGGADQYMKELEAGILPEIRNRTGIGQNPVYIAGYSLAGLFAMYSAMNLDVFDGFVSASGSMWYPGFLDYVKTHRISANVKKAYFSVGNKESKTRNPIMQPVEANTRYFAKYLSEQGIETIFELNEGGHFTDPERRLAKGIRRIIQKQEDDKENAE